MVPSRFNVQIPLPGRDEVFLMNTLSDAQLLVSADVAALFDRFSGSAGDPEALSADERDAVALLAEQGFLVADRESEGRALEQYFASVREDRDELRVTVLTTLQCNFACDYCYQGDFDDHGRLAEKMSLATAARVAAWIEAKLDEIQPARFSLTFFGASRCSTSP